MASSDSQIDKPQRGHPERAELPGVNINTACKALINVGQTHAEWQTFENPKNKRQTYGSEVRVFKLCIKILCIKILVSCCRILVRFNLFISFNFQFRLERL